MGVWRSWSVGRRQRRDRLDPVRWRVPRRGTVIRASLVAALLTLAAGVVWADSGGGDRCPPRYSRGSPSGTAAARTPAKPTGDGRALPVPPGMVGVPVRVAEIASVAVVRPGHRVDVIATPSGKPARTVAADLLVLAATSDDVTAVILVATTDHQARQLASSPPDVRLSITVRPD